ncbi:hypothetical protein WA026_019976, partial [Henosepilachna vigintioctopunctata]
GKGQLVLPKEPNPQIWYASNSEMKLTIVCVSCLVDKDLLNTPAGLSDITNG